MVTLRRDWWRREGRRLQPALREAVMACWDPIGVRGEPAASDEYDNYLPKIAALLHSGRDEQVLAAFLEDVRTQRMELPPDRERDEAAARSLQAWYAERGRA